MQLRRLINLLVLPTILGVGLLVGQISNGGGTYIGYGSVYPITNPTGVSFSWDNQGTASIATVGNSIFLQSPLDAGDQVRGRTIAVPSAPYSIIIGFIPWIHQSANSCGIYVTDGTKVITNQVSNQANNLGFSVIEAATHQYGSASIVATQGMQQTPAMVYLKILDNNTNLIFSHSFDGNTFIQDFSVGRVAFLTATQVGFFVDGHNSSFPAGLTLLSWAQGVS